MWWWLFPDFPWVDLNHDCIFILNMTTLRLLPPLLCAMTLLAACQPSIPPATQASVNVPEGLRVPPGHFVVLEAQARGAQIYECKAKADVAQAFEWSLKAPDANLFDWGGKRIGHHYAGPTWAAADGSKVIGEVKHKIDSPSTSAIPWLLIAAKSNEGEGIFGRVKWIQRINTVGGIAPLSGCSHTEISKEARVDYTATYIFYASAR